MQSLFELDGSPHWVSLVRTQAGWALAWNGGLSAVACEPLDGVRGRVTVGGRSNDIAYVLDGDTIHVLLESQTYVLRFMDPVEHYAMSEQAAGHDVARAPMPGLVLSVAVRPGERVAAGVTMMTIESMKLETAIKASRDGLVETVHVAAGQMFERDAALVTLVKGDV